MVIKADFPEGTSRKELGKYGGLSGIEIHSSNSASTTRIALLPIGKRGRPVNGAWTVDRDAFVKMCYDVVIASIDGTI
jgi:hypothetical protein